MYPVKFTGRRGTTECDAAFRTQDITRWQRWLKHARDNKATTVVTCCCLAAEDDVIRRRLRVNLSQTTDQCWLSSFPYTGHEHAPDCRFYSVWPDERQAAIYTTDVVKAGTDGMLIVRLPTGLQKKDAGEKTNEETPVKTGTGKQRRQPSMKLTGLLHLLWEQSGINFWHPAFDRRKRNPGWISWKLNNAAARIRIGRISLQESLLLMARKNTPQSEDNRRHCRKAEQSSRRLITVSQMATWNEATEARLQQSVPLGFFSGIPELQLPEDVLTRLMRSYARELRDWQRGARVIVISESEPPVTTFIRKDGRNVPQSCSRVIDVALMTVSPRFIPLDSSYEGVIEEKLWREKRTFIKPLRYDGEEQVFPDFMLMDVRECEALPMEVFGMNTPEYLLRKQEKVVHYDKEYGPGRWWHWDAAGDPDGAAIPVFPPLN
jgi:hypothetical protein